MGATRHCLLDHRELMEVQPMKLVFLGPPGAGKGTQADKVCAEVKIPHISTGDLLRQAIRFETPIGLSAKSYIDKGQLVPDSVVIEMVKERLAQKDCEGGFLLDGFPRTIEQAEALSGITGLDAVIDIKVPDENLVRRLSGRRVCGKCSGTYHIDSLSGEDCPKCGAKLTQRADDAPETVFSRLSVYHKQTAPLIDYYRQKGLLHEVDGAQPLETVFSLIMRALGQQQ